MLTLTPRRVWTSLAALIGALVLSGILLLAPSAVGASHPAMRGMSAAATPLDSPRAVALRQDMRKLWEDHITWTRLAIVDFAASLPSLPATEARLLRNQTDIGNAIVPFYGKAAGHELTGLLREHILGAVKVLEAAKAGAPAPLKASLAAWYRNGHQIAGFLAKANPRFWPRPLWVRMMNSHLALTTKEAVTTLGGQAEASVRSYDAIHHEALMMADILSRGIVGAFPQRFAGAQ
jgi:hypothetical protein